MLRGRSLLLVLLVLGPACTSKEKYDTTAVGPQVRADAGRIAISLGAPPALKVDAGILVVPVEVENLRAEAVVIHPDRCAVEQFDGKRVRPNERGSTYPVRAGGRRRLKLVFGDESGPVQGSSFRVYLWIESIAGGGPIGGVFPLVLQGNETFGGPPRPFTRETTPSAEADFPPPEVFTPANPARARGVARLCPSCGESRSGAATCGGCGAR